MNHKKIDRCAQRRDDGVWAWSEQLYMTKSLANCLYIQQRLPSHKFTDENRVGEQFDEFNKSIDDLENIDVR